MLMALMLALLNAAGAAPSPQDFENYKLKFRERGHHVHIDFGSTRPKDTPKLTTIGFGYEYYVDRQFNGVSFEVLGQKLGKLFKSPDGWWAGGGIAWWPIRQVKVFTQAGALIEDGSTAVQARVGVGYRLMFFMLGVMPFVYVQTTDDGRFSWALGARIQY